ncbi:MAG: GNAT family N-acetyltransferase [Synergistaceae bacterium]|nr:GNAT family N-acetyltransferase [Synergistaceae bacterium]
MPKIAAISITDDEGLLEGVLDFIDSISKKLGYARSKELKIRVACEELISDRIANAYPDGGMIGVDITLTNDSLEVSVSDKGLPYWKSESRYDPKNIDENASGLEDYLISKMADRTGSEKLGREGQRAYVCFALPVSAELKKRSAKENVPLDYDITIRETADDYRDIISAITCIYDEYQYSYAYERLYYPENFKELIARGKFRSFLAVNAHGEVAGHYGLSFSDDYRGMPEWASVVVRRPFRGRHIFDQMLSHGIEAAKNMGMRAIMTQPTAYHTATQKIAIRQGFIATGMLFQYVNSDMVSEYNTDGRRLDLAIAVKLLRGDTAKAVYLPEEHAPFLRGLYDRLGAEREYPEPFFNPALDTNLKHEISGIVKSGRIVVTRSGGDFEKELDQVTRTMRRNKVEMAELLISLMDPAAPFAYEKAKGAGYFFTGLIPGGEDCDYIVMQNLFGGEADAGAITATGEYEELLNYILKCLN